MNNPFFDVRMKGFRAKKSVHDLIQAIDGEIKPLKTTEALELKNLARRISARDVFSEINVPGFDRSAMDGYALIAENTNGATSSNPIPLKILDSAYPNQPSAKEITPGFTIRVMTGAPIPKGADAVLPFELASENHDVCLVHASVPPAKNIGYTGEDIKIGSLVLCAEKFIRPQDIGVLASIGTGMATVFKKPMVDLLITGNELLPPGQKPSGHQIVDSNSLMISALIERDGGTSRIHSPIKDSKEAIRNKILDSDADIILISGGSSVGQEDHIPSIINEIGELIIHGVSLRPAGPTGFGLVRGKPVFLLPGNPVSSLCSYDLFAGRAVRLLAHLNPAIPYAQKQLQLSKKILSQQGRVDYVRIQIQNEFAIPVANSGASILSSTTKADGFLLVDESHAEIAEGSIVNAYAY